MLSYNKFFLSACKKEASVFFFNNKNGIEVLHSVFSSNGAFFLPLEMFESFRGHRKDIKPNLHETVTS